MLEKQAQHTPSHGIHPEFDTRTMQYKDLQKLEEISHIQQAASVPNGYQTAVKRFIERHGPQLACEMTLEEISGVPMPKKDDFDWGKITKRELRVVLVDMCT